MDEQPELHILGTSSLKGKHTDGASITADMVAQTRCVTSPMGPPAGKKSGNVSFDACNFETMTWDIALMRANSDAG